MKASIGSWSQQAICKGYSYLFYPKDSERPQAKDRREQKAKTFCSICPVLNSCREYARNNSEFGVWGGESEEERYLAGYNLPRYAGVSVTRRLQRKRKAALETKVKDKELSGFN
jgi:WhiB family transcriptional regulator, redox-sensing transcriptional regulator